MYKVSLRKGFTGDRRNRAGISVSRTDVYEGDLTADQLKAIKADTELTLSEVKEETTTTRKMVEKSSTKKRG